MSCRSIRDAILKAEARAEAAPKVRAHLADCAPCRAWHARARAVESALAEMSGPAPERKSSFFEAFVEADVLPLIPHAPNATPPKKDLGRRKLAAAFAMASALLLSVIGGWWWHNYKGRTGKPKVEQRLSLAQQLESDPHWREAHSPRRRLLVLERHCQRLTHEALTAAREGSSDRLRDRTRHFRELVEGYVLVESMRLAERERGEVLPMVIQRLSRSESEAARLASEMPEMVEPLEEIAFVAREAEVRLRKLL